MSRTAPLKDVSSAPLGFELAPTREALAAVADLAARIWPSAYAGIISPEQIAYMLATRYSLDQLEADRQGGVRFVLATMNGERVGYFGYGPSEVAGESRLEKLYLLQSHHGQGIGSRMLQEALRRMRAEGYRGATLAVNRRNARAIRAYGRNGFHRRVAIVKDIGRGFVMDDYIMVHDLVPRPLPVAPPGARVKLRGWCEGDGPAFAELNADPVVMRYYLATYSAAESAATQDRYQTAIATRGWGFWAVEAEGQFAGLCGLNVPTFQAAFTPCVEIGWRFLRAFQGRGLALEAARAALVYAFGELRLEEVVAFTAVGNERSRHLMERLGMTHDAAEDFGHPRVAVDHPLHRHVLYRLRSPG